MFYIMGKFLLAQGSECSYISRNCRCKDTSVNLNQNQEKKLPEMHAPFHNTDLILLATVLQPIQHKKDLHSDIKERKYEH